MAKNSSKREVDSSRLLDIFSENDLRKIGFGDKTVLGLREDNYQHHSRRKEGYLGALVNNYLVRTNGASDNCKKGYVSAYLFSEAAGIDFDALLRVEDDGSPLTFEADFDGEKEVCIPINKLHLFTQRGQGLSLTELATIYARTKNSKIKNELISRGLGLVRINAERVRGGLPAIVDMDDLISYGSMGLLEAVEKYDPKRGIRFETFSAFRIRGAMIDSLRNTDELSRLDRKRATLMADFAKDFEIKNGYSPSFADYKDFWKESGIREDAFDDFYASVIAMNSGAHAISIDESHEDEEGATVGGTIEDKRSLSPLQSALQDEFLEQFEKDLQAVSERDGQILRMYFIDKIPLKAIGFELGISESRTSQIVDYHENLSMSLVRTKSYLEKQREIILHLD